MALTGQQRRQLVAQSHPLKPAVHVAADAIDDAVIAHVQASLAHRDLVKVRIAADSAAECDAAAVELARRIPCEVVKRIGRVVLLYVPPPAETGARPPGP